MQISKQGNELFAGLFRSLKVLDAEYQGEPTVDRAVQRFSIAKTLHLLFNDPSEIIYSQLLLSEQYFLLSSYDLARTYASEVLQKDKSLNDKLRFRADIVLLKIKAQVDSVDAVLESVEVLRTKFGGSEGWTDGVELEIVKIEAGTYKEMKEYGKAIQIISSAIESIKGRGKHNTHQHVELLLENARSYFSKGDCLKAASQQKEAIGIHEIYCRKDSQELVKMYLDLSKYEEKLESMEDEFRSLRKAEEIYKTKHSGVDKMAVDMKRRICQNLEKRDKNKDAMKEFELLKELINEKYGSFSIEMADAKKRLGKIYEKLEKKNEAMLEYSEAANIYSENKDKKQMEECRGAMYRIKPHRLQIYKSVPAI